jgi:hypothetical protein
MLWEAEWEAHMARTVSLTEMEMEMEMEMDAGPSTPFPLASPVVRPTGVSPVVASEPGDWYRGNKWPPAHREEDREPKKWALPDKRTIEWVARFLPEAKRDGQEPLPDRQWTSQFYSIALLGEFIHVSIEIDPKKEHGQQSMSINKECLTWDSIDLQPKLFLPDVAENANNGRATTELRELIRLIDYRPGVLSEALAQRNGIDNYFRGIFTFTASSHPRTFGLMQIVLRVGESQVMYYKYKFNRPRPSQLCPVLMPPIEVPGHASYPSGHATQAHLVALILSEVLPRPAKLPLRLLAERIARNREVLGLHYPSDSRAGAKLAEASFRLLLKCPTVQAMLKAARQEWGNAEEGARAGANS